jgi:hypothetical protein
MAGGSIRGGARGIGRRNNCSFKLIHVGARDSKEGQKNRERRETQKAGQTRTWPLGEEVLEWGRGELVVENCLSVHNCNWLSSGRSGFFHRTCSSAFEVSCVSRFRDWIHGFRGQRCARLWSEQVVRQPTWRKPLRLVR